MIQHQFVPPSGAFTRSFPVRFSHCDPAGIVYFPHYFDMFNGLIEDWYTQELGYDYAELITSSDRSFRQLGNSLRRRLFTRMVLQFAQILFCPFAAANFDFTAP
jgi:hypothetical protein